MKGWVSVRKNCLGMNEFNIHQLAQLSVEEIQDFLSKKMLEIGYGSYFCGNQALDGFYRARKHNHFKGSLKWDVLTPFIHIGEYWNPPPNKIRQRGRCNDVNQSILYTSNSLEVAVLEVRPEEGDYISVAKFDLLPVFKTIRANPVFRINIIGVEYLSKIHGFVACLEQLLSVIRSDLLC